MEYKEQNKGSLDGVTRRFELECCTFLGRQRKYSARIWSRDPSNFSKFKAEYEYLNQLSMSLLVQPRLEGMGIYSMSQIIGNELLLCVILTIKTRLMCIYTALPKVFVHPNNTHTNCINRIYFGSQY